MNPTLCHHPSRPKHIVLTQTQQAGPAAIGAEDEAEAEARPAVAVPVHQGDAAAAWASLKAEAEKAARNMW